MANVAVSPAVMLKAVISPVVATVPTVAPIALSSAIGVDKSEIECVNIKANDLADTLDKYDAKAVLLMNKDLKPTAEKHFYCHHPSHILTNEPLKRVGIVWVDCAIAAKATRRVSGTATSPIFGSKQPESTVTLLVPVMCYRSDALCRPIQYACCIIPLT